MKKTVKSLIIAASVAAIAGIGAVSFAKWTVGNTSEQTATGSAGELTAVGAITLASNLNDDMKLVPYDQDNYSTAKLTNLWVITVTPPTAMDGYTYSYEVEYAEQATDDLTGDKMYVFTGTTAPTADDGTIDITDGNWAKLDATQDVTLLDNKIYVVMNSTGENANDDMNANFGLKVILTATADNA